MRKKSRIRGFGVVTSAVAITVMASGAAWWKSANAGSPAGKQGVASLQWPIVRVELPAGDETFPPGSAQSLPPANA
jgi:hypothetical protein